MAWWLFQNSVVVALLALIVAGWCRFAPPNPAVRHALWAIILIKLMIPPIVTWPWALPLRLDDDGNRIAAEGREAARSAGVETDLAAGAFESPEIPQSPEGPESTDWPANPYAHAFELALSEPEKQARDEGAPDDVPAPEGGATGAAAVSPLAASFAAAIPAPDDRSTARLLFALGGVVWAAGALAFLLMHAYYVVRFRRLVRRGQPAPKWLCDQVAQLATRFGVRPPLPRLVPGLGTPALWCLGRAELLWPMSIAAPADPERWRGIIAHELAHLRRRDHWIRWLEIIAGMLWWWNPLYWVVRRQVRQNAEFASDAWVVWAFPRDRRRYAEALIDVLHLVSLRATPAAAHGLHGAGRRSFERRLTMIIKERCAHRVSFGAFVAIALVALAMLPCIHQGTAAGEPSSGIARPVAENAPVPPPPPVPAPPPPTLPTPPPFDGSNVGAPPPAPSREAEIQLLMARIAQLEQELRNLSIAVEAMRGTVSPAATFSYGSAPPAAEPRSAGGGFATTRRGSRSSSTTTRLSDAGFAAGSVAFEARAVRGELRIFKPTKRQPQVVYEAAQTLLMNDRNVPLQMVLEPRTGTLMAHGAPEALARLEGLVALLESDGNAPAVDPTVQVLRLRHAAPDVVAQLVEELGIDARAVADTRSKSLIVSGPPAQIEQVKKIVEALDVEGAGAAQEPGSGASSAAPRSNRWRAVQRTESGATSGAIIPAPPATEPGAASSSVPEAPRSVEPATGFGGGG